MTGRRRSSGGSHRTSTSSTPSHRSSPDGSSTTTSRGRGRGDGVGVNVDSIHTMAGRLENTRGRVEGVGNTVRGVNVGPESMGIVGTTFTGAAQQHLRTAEQHVARTTRAVDQAHRGTQGTAQAYRDTDAANAANLSGIDTATRPPAPTSASSTTHTPASSGTTPSSAPTTTTPSGSTTHTPAAPGSTPSHAPTPPGAGGPPGPPGGGGPPPPPHNPPGGGTPTGPTPSTGGAPRNPWKALVRKNFNDKDYATFERAMDKMSRDPEAGHLPGSGRLTMEERKIMARAQGLAQIEPGTMMHKSIPAADWPNYQSGRYNTVGGFVARSEDMTHLRTSDDIVQGQRLDYENTKFHPGQDVYVVEFPAGNPGHYQVPFGSSYEPSLGQNAYDPDVVAAERRMVGAAVSEGFDVGQIDRDARQWPNTGGGVTGDADLGVPEFTVDSPDGSGRIPIPPGSVAYRYDAAGNKVYVGTYDRIHGRFM